MVSAASQHKFRHTVREAHSQHPPWNTHNNKRGKLKEIEEIVSVNIITYDHR